MSEAASSAQAYPRHFKLWSSIPEFLPAGELAHDIDHLRRVYHWSLRLAPETGADFELAGATAIVHDLAFVPKNHVDRPLGGERSAVLALTVLAEAGYSADESAQIAEAVRTSSWSRGLEPTSALGIVLQDADRLDAIGAVGIARVFSCAQHMSTGENPGRFYDPADPFAGGSRLLDDRRQALDHFAAKLLKLAAGMRLPSAQREAERRHQAMLAFLSELRRELASGGPKTAT